MVQPSSRREGFSAIPNVKWEDVGGLDSLRKEFDRYIVRRIKFPEDYEVRIISVLFTFLSFISSLTLSKKNTERKIMNVCICIYVFVYVCDRLKDNFRI